MRRNSINIALAVVNLIAAVIYVARASEAWVNPAEGGRNAIAGEPCVWAVRAVPVVLVFLIINVVWGITMLVSVRWRSSRLYASVWLLWIIAIVIDFAHH
jgi:hypothetical protein